MIKVIVLLIIVFSFKFTGVNIDDSQRVEIYQSYWIFPEIQIEAILLPEKIFTVAEAWGVLVNSVCLYEDEKKSKQLIERDVFKYP